MVVQKIGLPILRIFKYQTKLFLFNLYTIKDNLLWRFLLSRFQALQDSPWINGEFVIILILINGATIFLAQSLMGLYIFIEADSLLSVPEKGLRKIIMLFILLPLMPFVPSLLILKATAISKEKENLLMEWKSAQVTSPSNIASRLNFFETKVDKSLHTFATLKLIEACLEVSPADIIACLLYCVSF